MKIKLNPAWVYAPFAFGFRIPDLMESHWEHNIVNIEPVIYRRQRVIGNRESLCQEEESYAHLPENIKPHPDKYFPRMTADGKFVLPEIDA